MTFAHPNGIDILLKALNVSHACFPAEVYNWDEASRPIKSKQALRGYEYHWCYRFNSSDYCYAQSAWGSRGLNGLSVD